MASSYGHGRRQPDGAERERETGAQYASRPNADVLWALEPAHCRQASALQTLPRRLVADPASAPVT